MSLVFRWLALLALTLPLVAQELELELVVSGLSSPVDIQDAGDGSGRLFVVEQGGRIRIVQDGALLNQPFLDIDDRVVSGSERGLLGLAFPPGFAQSQRFYVNYTGAGGDTVISMFEVTGDPDIADPSSEVVLLTIDQPFSNHNGGQIQFGPGGLYIATGDGGSGGDPLDAGQRLDTLLGKILRIDVEGVPGTLQIPGGNPFVGVGGARDEIWAYGLRNPWRFSFDGGNIWIADVGQNRFEEVNRANASSGGLNYGWRILEADACFAATECDMSGLVLPIHSYSHGQGCSVTGGYVYRGDQAESLRGVYIYGDYCSGQISGIDAVGQNRFLLNAGFSILTFGIDDNGEVYVGGGGSVYRIVEIEPAPMFSSAGVVNAASFEQGLVPGSLASIFVSGVRAEEGVSEAQDFPLPFSIDGVSVTMGGAPAPLLAVANVDGVEQVNVQVPWALLNDAFAPIVVTFDGTSSSAVLVEVDSAQPAVFLVAEGQPAILRNEDFALVTQQTPLASGDFAAAYLTGLGAVANRPSTGRAAEEADATVIELVEATLDGEPAEIVFSGLAPGFVGLYQVNFRVPLGASSGLLTLVFRVDGVPSPPVEVWVE